MFDKALSLALMILGTAVIAISMLADVIGIGAEPNVIGWKQYSGAAVGLVIVFFGAHLAIHHVLRK
jgi:hypothetical protein